MSLSCSLSRLDAQLKRFVHLDQGILRVCAQTSPRVAQLAWSFPLLFAMLATRYGSDADRVQVVRSAALGQPLRELAAQLHVPFSLRHIPPESCPKYLHPFAWAPESARLLRAFIPYEPQQARCWLEAIFFAGRLGGDAAAYWMARQGGKIRLVEAPFRALFPLVLFAWVSKQQTQLIGPCQGWTPELSARNAVALCQRWLIYLDQAAAMGAFGIADPWIERQELIDGHSLVPLTTIKAISDEARAWNNCLMDYIPFVADDTCRLFSIRKEDERIAVIEVQRSPHANTMGIAQIQPLIALASAPKLHAALRRLVEQTPCSPARARPPLAVVSKIHLATLLRRYRASVPTSEHGWLSELTTLELTQDISNLALWLRYSDDDHRFEARLRQLGRRAPRPLPRRG